MSLDFTKTDGKVRSFGMEADKDDETSISIRRMTEGERTPRFGFSNRSIGCRAKVKQRTRSKAKTKPHL